MVIYCQKGVSKLQKTSKIAESVLELIGKTPMVKLKKTDSNMADIFAKIEFFNPGGSIKDRIALKMIDEAEKKGVLAPDGVIVEATSGNTGIGLAIVAAVKNYRLILVMPETMSLERQNLLKAHGAELYLTPGSKGMTGSIEKALELVRENKNYFMPSQFENAANPTVHGETTALEILEQTDGAIDAFVAGIGTGGTITGVGQVLKSRKPETLIIGVEPKKSSVLSGGKPGMHKIQGIGAGFIPKVLKKQLLDDIIPVEDEDAYSQAMLLAREEGLMVGISAGAAVWGAKKVAQKLGEGKRVVVILPDTGERYLSMHHQFENLK